MPANPRAVLNANGVYWDVIELGLALCAVNLPITYGVIGRKYTEPLLKYLRSWSIGHSRSSSQRDHVRFWGEATSENDPNASNIQMINTLMLPHAHIAHTRDTSQDGVLNEDHGHISDDIATDTSRV